MVEFLIIQNKTDFLATNGKSLLITFLRYMGVVSNLSNLSMAMSKEKYYERRERTNNIKAILRAWLLLSVVLIQLNMSFEVLKFSVID